MTNNPNDPFGGPWDPPDGSGDEAVQYGRLPEVLDQPVLPSQLTNPTRP